MIRETFGIERRVAGGNVAFGEPQELRILRFGLAAPFLEGRTGRNACRNPRIEEGVELLLIAEQIDAPPLLLQVLGVLEQLQVVREERRTRVVFHEHQRVAYEHLARGLRIDLLVGHAATRGEQ